MNKITINAGTVTGPHHKKHNEGNQDAYAYMQENGYSVFSVCDGLGSYKNSEIGASIASATSVEEALDSLISGHTIEDALEEGIKNARETIINRDDWKELGCTLSLGIITEHGWGVGIVGDAFAIVSLDQNFHTFIQPDSQTEFANTTKVLTSNDYDPLIVFGNETITALSLSSDGLMPTSIDMKEKKASDGFWTPVITRAMNQEMDVQKFLEYMEISEKLVDDTTLLIASRNL